MSAILVKHYGGDFPINQREIWRYAGLKAQPNEQLQSLLDTVIADLAGKLSCRVCYREFVGLPLWTDSKDLARCLKDCKKTVLFCATIGLELDRYIAKYQHISATRALLAQAYGAERIEALCDAFCGEFAGATLRFSPGYGDLPLETQKDFFALLDCAKQIGVSLSDSLLMTPSKSVTAIFGVGGLAAKKQAHHCENCNQLQCNYRR